MFPWIYYNCTSVFHQQCSHGLGTTYATNAIDAMMQTWTAFLPEGQLYGLCGSLSQSHSVSARCGFVSFSVSVPAACSATALSNILSSWLACTSTCAVAGFSGRGLRWYRGYRCSSTSLSENCCSPNDNYKLEYCTSQKLIWNVQLYMQNQYSMSDASRIFPHHREQAYPTTRQCCFLSQDLHAGWPNNCDH